MKRDWPLPGDLELHAFAAGGAYVWLGRRRAVAVCVDGDVLLIRMGSYDPYSEVWDCSGRRVER